MNRPVVLLSVAVAALFAGYCFFVKTVHLAEIDALQTRVRETYQRVEFDESQASRLEQLEASVARLTEWRTEITDRLSPDPDAPELLMDVSRALESFGLTTDRASVQPKQEDAGYVSQRADLVVTGAFVDVFRFIHHLEESRLPSRVTDLRVQPGASGGVQAAISLQCWWRGSS